MAQAEHLEESSALASRIQEELAGVTGSEGRGIKQAPFRVLVGAAMPAVLVEVAFISNPEEEKDLVSERSRAKLAAALLRGIARYERRTRPRAPVGRAPRGHAVTARTAQPADDPVPGSAARGGFAHGAALGALLPAAGAGGRRRGCP